MSTSRSKSTGTLRLVYSKVRSALVERISQCRLLIENVSKITNRFYFAYMMQFEHNIRTLSRNNKNVFVPASKQECKAHQKHAFILVSKALTHFLFADNVHILSISTFI